MIIIQYYKLKKMMFSLLRKKKKEIDKVVKTVFELLKSFKQLCS